MKRMLSLFLVMIMILLIIMPSYVLAENPIVPIFRYGNIKILVPPKGYNIEDDFREFVKQVSRMYYSGRLDGVNGVYDLNKYYYQAAEVKHEWDDGGFFWSRRDNPYSTYYDYEDYEKYNASAVQSMLINGIQEKANELKGLDTNKSKFRISANPTNGKWEINGEALIAQSIYDKNLEGTLAKAEQNIVAGDLIGSLVDTGIAVFSGGAAPSAVYELIDSISAVVTNSIVAYTDAMYQNAVSNLENEYRNVVKQSFVAMQKNIDEQLLSDYRQLYDELSRKTVLNKDQEVLYEQLENLLSKIDQVVETQKLPYDISLEIDQAAEELVEGIGLEIQPVLSNEEVARLVVVEIVKTTTNEIIKNLYNEAFTGNEIEIAIYYNIISSAINACIYKNAFNVHDFNNDGYYSADDILRSVMDIVLGGELIKDVLKAIDDELVKKNIKKLELKKLPLIDDMKILWNDYVFKRYKNEPILQSAVNTKLQLTSDRIDEIQREIDDIDTKHNSIGALIDDMVSIAIDTFSLAKDSVGLGDEADGEIYYAYHACSMYHTKISAESRRNSLQKDYIALKDPSNIDKAEISLLKNFVNRVYSVYEMDMLGHSYYVTLAAGWQYQTQEKFNEVMVEFHKFQDKLQAAYGTAGQYALNILGGWGVLPIYAWIGGQKSEYLKAVNQKYPFTTTSFAQDVYGKIATYANGAQIPAQFKYVGN